MGVIVASSLGYCGGQMRWDMCEIPSTGAQHVVRAQYMSAVTVTGAHLGWCLQAQKGQWGPDQ